MRLGLGLYRHMLDEKHFQFARQCGCTDIIIHLAEYYNKEIVTATDDKNNYGVSNPFDPIWQVENLAGLQELAAKYDLNIYGVENFSPADWYDVLLDGPRKQKQIEYLTQLIRNIGQVGIKSLGYNFSLAGVWGHQKKSVARGGAIATCFDHAELPSDSSIPKGEIWNMTYEKTVSGNIEEIDSDELWSRYQWFMEQILPVAEEAGVEMALHPDDPPMPRLRNTPRLVYRPELYQKAIDIVPCSSNMLEFCLGSLQEMHGEDIYTATERYVAQNKISYIHFRNVKGKVPKYTEMFIDDGDIDMIRILRILKKHDFKGVLIPDHTPQMTCDAPWHAGMAFALGYMKAAMQMV